MLVLLSIGLKGGIELAMQPFGALALQALAVMAIGVLLPLVAFPVLRFMGRFPRADAASVAAHFGSVIVGAYAVATTYLASRQIDFESHTGRHPALSRHGDESIRPDRRLGS